MQAKTSYKKKCSKEFGMGSAESERDKLSFLDEHWVSDYPLRSVILITTLWIHWARAADLP